MTDRTVHGAGVSISRGGNSRRTLNQTGRVPPLWVIQPIDGWHLEAWGGDGHGSKQGMGRCKNKALLRGKAVYELAPAQQKQKRKAKEWGRMGGRMELGVV